MIEQTYIPFCQSNARVSCIMNEELAADIKLYLESVGKYVRAIDIVHFLEDPVVHKHYGLKKTVSLKTAQRWLVSYPELSLTYSELDRV